MFRKRALRRQIAVLLCIFAGRALQAAEQFKFLESLRAVESCRQELLAPKGEDVFRFELGSADALNLSLAKSYESFPPQVVLRFRREIESIEASTFEESRRLAIDYERRPDEAGLTRLFESLRLLVPSVVRHFMGFLPDAEVLEDFLQSGYLRLWENLIELGKDSPSPVNSVRGWSVFIDHLRGGIFDELNRLLQDSLEPSGYREREFIENQGPLNLLNEERKRAIRAALLSLTWRRERLIRYRFGEDLTLEEISQRPGVGLSTERVRQLLLKTLRELKGSGVNLRPLLERPPGKYALASREYWDVAYRVERRDAMEAREILNSRRDKDRQLRLKIREILENEKRLRKRTEMRWLNAIRRIAFLRSRIQVMATELHADSPISSDLMTYRTVRLYQQALNKYLAVEGRFRGYLETYYRTLPSELEAVLRHDRFQLEDFLEDGKRALKEIAAIARRELMAPLTGEDDVRVRIFEDRVEKIHLLLDPE